MGCHSLLQETFLTQGLNLGLPLCRQTLYRLSHQGSPKITINPIKFWQFSATTKGKQPVSLVSHSCLILQNLQVPSGSSVHGIFQARVLEWGAIAFSGNLCRSRIFVWKFISFRLQMATFLANTMGFPDSSVGKESAYNAGDWFNSCVRKIPWRRDRLPTPVFFGFPCGSAGKESACNVGDLGSIPELWRFPWRRERLPTPVF